MAQNLTYTQCSDYYIPDIRLEHTGTQMLGKYGRMRRVFLEQNKPMLFSLRMILRFDGLVFSVQDGMGWIKAVVRLMRWTVPSIMVVLSFF